jgi:tetratricopeptide (TPR) repeat protein
VNRQQRRAEKRQHGKAAAETPVRPAPAPVQDIFDAAVAHHQAGRVAEAEALYRQVLALSPDHADSLNLLGVAAIQSGRSETAIALFARAVAANPRADSYHSNLGSALAGAGRLEEAIGCFRRALDLRPDSPEAQNNLGNALLDQGEPEAAMPYLRRAIALRPDYAEAQYNLGIALVKLRQPDEAVACYRRALAVRPDYPDALNNLGQTLWELGAQDEATDCFRRALALRPDSPEALNNLGISLREKGQRSEAAEHFRRAVALRPAYLEALTNLAMTLNDLGRFEEAAAAYRQGLAIKPDLVHERNNLGAALAQLGRFEEAGECYRQALSRQPDYPEALNNLGNVLRAQGRLDEAIAAYRQAAALKDDYPDVHHNLAMALLASGELAAGWTEYEWRWRTDQLRAAHRDFGKPLWRGEAGAGRTLLIHAEQGFGDTIQFCRYAPLAAARGWRVVMMVQRALVRLLGSLDGVAEVRPARGDPPPCDAQCPMMSLPLALGTTLATIPAPRSYLHADPREVSAWGERLAALGGRGVRVGLVWAGNPGRSPILSAVDRRRSMPLDRMAPIFAVPGVQFVRLQKDQRAAAEAHAMVDVMDHMKDFADTAALVTQLDLVISVDTAVAHLASALGRPVWLLDRYDPCWRWLTGRQDSPWYPALRLYRQTAPGDWDGVVATVAQDLHRFAAAA